MRNHIIAAAALALCLLTGCAGRSVAQYLVVSSMAVDCSSAPITAVLEIAGEEQNDYMTLQGDSYGDIFAQAQRRSGRQVYLGAMQGVVFGGVPDGKALLSQLTALQSDSRISPNLQIALCENAQEFYSDGADGEKVAALLTLQYTDSRRSSLKELLNLFGAEGRDGLIAWVSTGDGELILDGVVPTGGSDYTAVWKPNGFGSLLLHRQEEMRLTVTENGASAGVSVSRLKLSRVAVEGSRAKARFSAVATVQSLSGPGMSRETLEEGLRRELMGQIEELDRAVMQNGKSDLLGIEKRAQLMGSTVPEQLYRKTDYSVDFILRDPKGLLER